MGIFYGDNMGSNIEIEMLLTDLPIELLKENVKSQIYDTSGSVNYLNVVPDKLRMIEEQYEDPDIHARVNDIRNAFFGEIIAIIEERFNISINIDYSNPTETEDIAMDLYEFFIVELHKNTSKYILNYIRENKKELVDELELPKPMKDVTTGAVRKKFKSIDVKILSNLYEVANHIVGLEIQDDAFLNYTRNTSIYNMYVNGIISGAVAEEFLLFAKSNDVIFEIVPEIYSTLSFI